MKDEHKTKERLINELVEMRRRITELETLEAERKRAEEALRESEEKYRTLIESSLTGIFIHQDGKYVFINDRFAEVHGYKAEELLGKEYLTLIHPDEREIMKEIVSKRLKGKAVPQRYEVRRLRKDGKTIWCETMATRIQYKGRPAVMGNCIDITERKRTEEALRASEHKYRTLLENLPQKIFHKDKNSIYVSCNKNYARDLKIKPDEITGKTDYEFFPKELAKKYRADDKRIMESEKTEDIEESYIQNGRGVIVHTVKTPIKDERGNTVGILGIFWDITERKRVEEALRESEGRYRILFNKGNDAVLVYQLTTEGMLGKFIEVNDVACQRLGYTREELLKLTPLNIICPEKLGDMPALIEKLLAEEYFLFEAMHIAKDGRNIPVEINAHLFNLHGQPTVLCIARDITERKRAEEALRESEEKYRSLVESSEDSIYLVDGNCKYLFMNNEHLSRLGLQMSQVVGRTYGEFHSPEETEEFARKIKEVLEAGKSLLYEYRSERDNRYFIRTLSPVKDSKTRMLTAVTVISKDITEREKAEEALQESEEKYRELVNTSVDGIISVDPQMKITLWNKGAERIFGYTQKEVLGQSLMKIVPERYRKTKEKGFARLRKTGSGPVIGKTLELEGLRKDGTEVPIELSVSSRKIGETYIATAIVRDITERKKAETHLIQAAKMGTLGEMASGIAHELNQPLSVIKVGSDFFLKMIKRGEKIDDEELRIVAQEVGTQVDRASEIINHLRIFARPSEIVKAKIDINAPIRDVFKILGQQLKVHRIEVELDLNENLPSVMADHNRLEQVFINLVLNAIDAMDEKEKRLGREKTKNVLSIRSYLEDREIVVTVSDTGIGIPEKIMDRLFEPFFTTKQVGKGTGLGLSISYGIVKDYDGAIDVKSEEGIGTTLILRLPACFTC